jgi:hypothetical protein
MLGKSWIQILVGRSAFLTEVSNGFSRFNQANAVKPLFFVKRPWEHLKTLVVGSIKCVINMRKE